MKQLRIPVAAPEPGLFYDHRSEKTDFQRYNDSFRDPLKPRMFHRSSFVRLEASQKEPRLRTYRCADGRGIRGKAILKWRKKLKVKGMKAAGHFRGHNSPYVPGTIYLP